MIEALPSPESVLDRDCEQRQEAGYLDAVQGRAGHRIMVFQHGKTLVHADAVVYLDPAAQQLSADTLTIYLGKTLTHPTLPEGTDIVLKVLADDAGPLAGVPDEAVYMGYRDAAAMLSAADAAIFIQAQAVANWHQSHPRCPRCGAATDSECSGWMRRCTQDGSEHFPRTDPAVIVAIEGPGEKILLASNFAWPANRYSTVAGFVEAGESAEQAAVREIAEEVGVHLHATHYVGSQAWPFPRSLMLGFMAYTHDTNAVPDAVEVREARWFSREELQAAVLTGEAGIPGRLSISRELIEHWYGGPIAEPGDVPVAVSGGRA